MGVTTYEPTEGSERPVLLKLSGMDGYIRFHVDRGSRILYLHAYGPRGGERGSTHFNMHKCSEVRRFAISATDETLGMVGVRGSGGGRGGLYVSADRGDVLASFGARSSVVVPVSPDELGQFAGFMMAWATEATRSN